MKAAVWYDPRYGPALLATLPADNEMPEFASIAKKLPAGIRQAFLAKGSDLDWPEWAQHLTERQPYGGTWRVEDVPDGVSLHESLSKVRHRVAEQNMKA